MYYFGGSDDGSMKTGSQTVKDDNGDSFKFYFGTKNSTTEKKGVGITGNKNNKLYYMGHLVTAQDYKYQPVWIDMDGDTNEDELFIVNQNGSIQHSKVEYKEDGDVLINLKAKDADDNDWAIAFKETNAGLSKYAIDVANTADLAKRITVDPIEARTVMPVHPLGPVTPGDVSPANAQ